MFNSICQLPQKSVVNFSFVLLRTTVRLRAIRYEMRKHEQTACDNIPLPSYLIELIDIPPSLHPFRIHEFDFVDTDLQ